MDARLNGTEHMQNSGMLAQSIPVRQLWVLSSTFCKGLIRLLIGLILPASSTLLLRCSLHRLLHRLKHMQLMIQLVLDDDLATGKCNMIAGRPIQHAVIFALGAESCRQEWLIALVPRAGSVKVGHRAAAQFGPQCAKVSAAGRLYLKPSFKLLLMLDDINGPLTLLVHLLQDVVGVLGVLQTSVVNDHENYSQFYFCTGVLEGSSQKQCDVPANKDI